MEYQSKLNHMINKYTLHFVETFEERQFIEGSRDKILREFSTFALLSGQSFSFLQMLSFLSKGQVLFTTISALAVGTTILAYFLIRNSPGHLNGILMIYQVFTAVAFGISPYIDTEYQFQDQYRWFYGFQCSFFHFYIYLQGLDYVRQSAILLIAFMFHVSWLFDDGQDAIFNFIIFFWIYCCMVAIRYVVEFDKRTSFIYMREQLKWNQTKLIEQTLNSWMVLVRFDEKQNQLAMVQCNRSLRHRYGIKGDSDLRRLFRKIQIRVHKRPNFVTKSLETLLLEAHLHEPTKDRLKGIHKPDSLILDVKIVKCYQNNELMFLVVLEGRVEQQLIKQLKRQVKTLYGLLMEVQKVARANLTQVVRKNRMDDLLRIGTYLNLNSFLNLESMVRSTMKDDEFPLSRLHGYLKTIFNNLMHIKSQTDIHIRANFQQLVQLHLTIISLVLNLAKSCQQPLNAKTILLKCHPKEHTVLVELGFVNTVLTDPIIRLLNTHRSRSVRYKSMAHQKRAIDKLCNPMQPMLGFKLQHPHLGELALETATHLLAQMGPYNYLKACFDVQQVQVRVSFTLYTNRLSQLKQSDF